MQYEIQIKRPASNWERFSTYKTLRNAERYLALYTEQAKRLKSPHEFRIIDLNFRLTMQ